MATENINVGVNISDNGSSKKLQTNIESAHKAITSLAKAAANVNMGGTAGSRAVYAKADPGAVTQYGQQRGAAGATGASARDFANQAQGLGGLVRLYATYAANVFAVGAAFRALSSAMDTTNMIRGLDQLGTQSGTALGSLSKRLAAASDGAVSLREAMEATAKASSSGMSSEAILRMGKVAKQASQALGVDMSDALSRITRGVTKLEPELLDELGIFTKVGKATEDYAKSVGKSASALTDFERRMAFTNAVLAEGEKKFGAINLDTNPYSKLSAAMANLAQNGLELANKVLAPIVKILSESPTALVTAVSSLGLILVKQALPALGEFKAGLQATADKAGSIAQKKGADAVAARKAVDAQVLAGMKDALDAQVSRVDAAQAKIDSIHVKGAEKNTKAYKALSKNIHEITEADLATIENRAKKLETGSFVDKATAAGYREGIKEIVAVQKGEIDLQNLQKQGAQQRERDAKGWTQYGLTVRAAKEAELKATRANIIANAAYNGSLIGTTGAYKLLKAEVASDESMSKWEKRATVAKGTAAAFFGQLGSIANKIGAIGQVVGIAVGAFALLDGMLSKTGAKMSEFNSSTDRLNSSADMLKKTLATVFENTPFSVQSLQAQANAMMEFSDSIAAMTKSAKAAEEATNKSTWDSITNAIASAFGGGIRKNFAKSLSDSITTAVESLEGSPTDTKLKEKLASILDIKDLNNLSEFTAAIKKLTPESSKIFLIRDAIKSAGVEAGIAASRSKEFSSSFGASSESFKTLARQFAVQDPLSDWAVKNIETLGNLSNVLNGPITGSLDSLSTLINGINANPIFGEDTSKNIAAFKDDINSANADINLTSTRLKDLEKQLATAKDTARKTNNRENTVGNSDIGLPPEFANARAANSKDRTVQSIEEAIARARVELATAKAKATEIAVAVSGSINQGIGYSIGLIATSLSAALAKGSTQLLQSLYSRIDNIPELAGKQYDLKIQELQSEASLIKVNQELVRITALSAAVISADTAQRRLEAIKKEAGTNNDEVYRRAIRDAQSEADSTSKQVKFLTNVGTDPVGSLKEYEKAIKSGDTSLTKYASSIINTTKEMVGFTVQLRNNAQQQQLIRDIEKPVAELQATTKARKELETSTATALSNQIQDLNVQKETGKISEQNFILENAKLETKKLDNSYTSSSLDIQEKLNTSYIVAAALIKQGKLDDAAIVISKADALALTERSNALETKKVGIANISLKTANENAAFAKKELEYRLQVYDKTLELSVLERDREKTLKAITLETAAQTEKFSPEYLASLQDSASKNTATSTAQSSMEAETTKYSAKRFADEIELARLKEIGSKVEAERLAGLMQQDIDIFSQKLINIEAEKTARLAAIDEVVAYRKEREKYTDTIESIKSIDNIWAGVGTTLAGVYEEIDKARTKQNQYAADLKDLEDKKKKTSDPETIKKIEEDIVKTKQKGFTAEIAGMAKITSATKKAFSEKTAAYKIAGAIEKTLHVASMAMKAAEFMADNKLTLSSIGNSLKEAAANGMAAITAALKAPFPIGFAAGAAMAAIVAGLVGSLGGGGSAPTFAATSEQQQAVQGTAMSYDTQGNLVQTSRGIFGDTSAKSESIANSLEIIRDNSIDGLDYDNKMLRALENLSKSLDTAAKQVYGVKGLSKGSLSGITEGTNTSGGFLGIGGLFSSSTTKSIIDSGLQLKGTFLDLANGVRGTVNTFETISTTVKKSGFFGIGASTRTTNSTLYRNLGDVDAKAAASISNAFKYGADVLYSIADLAGVAESSVTNVLANIDISKIASLRGLTGEAFTKELSAVIGSAMDDASLAIFSSFEQYANFGEGMLETVVRVVDTNTKISQLIDNLGMKTTNLKGRFAVTEALANAAGGLDKFADQADYFSQNFLTEADRLVPKQKAVTKELARLGLSSIDTKDEFKNLVQGLNLTKEADANLYQSLMEIAPAFNDVAEAAEKGLQSTIDKFKVFGKTLREFRDSLLLGAQSPLTPQQRYEEARKQYETVSALALAGDIDAQGKFTSVSTAFLDASRVYNATSSAYIKDFNDVLTKVDAGIVTSEAEVSLAQRQLGILTSIDANIALIAGVPAKAAGGMAKGLTLVGELGPELVDFQSPGRVYTAEQTFGMFNGTNAMPQTMNQMIQELKQVKQEIAKLREDQQQQTGDLIMSNYDANLKASKEVATTLEDTANSNWAQRTQVVIA